MAENTRATPTDPKWAEDPDVESVVYYVEDNGIVYPREFLKVNGILFEKRNVRELLQQIKDVL